MVKLYIDAGHGGNDSGASGNGLKEKDLTLSIIKRIKKYLDNHYSGHTTKLSRTNDKTLSLSQRTNEANSWGADYFLSIHINSGGGTGYEDYIYSGEVQKRTISIRDTMHTEVVKQIPEVTNRGKKRANLHVTRESHMPAVLTENLFIDTKKDADKLKDGSFLDRLAKGHAIGLAKAFNLKSKSGASSKPSSSKPTQSSRLNKTNSNNELGLVDWMKSKGMDSSYSNRKKLAAQYGISNYSGTAAQNNKLLSKLKLGKPTRKGDQTTNSIVDYLKSINADSSFSNRRKLAEKYGINNYSGTSAQNIKLLNAMRQGGASSKKTATTLKVGDTVTLKDSASHFATGESILSSVKGKKYNILQIKSDRVLLDKIMSWVKKSDVQ